ncbi:hypothetical protein PtA15_10A533 [Puccinia triticina]|uniref:Uncharacterized protein n=1 Tax=Puccinia triticina TaxID=208348 RepID=A0ABY7CWU7_9BASI|nr:uncharacterized protein PtA15_10A533 [Puccinia triticina]WAQ89109.1 hypothetical protein PtA15_10A533 [Puccinia triticina]
MAQQTQADSSALDTQRRRFLKLHAAHKDPDQLFCKLTDAAGLEKVQQHNDRLDGVLNHLEPDFTTRERIGKRWNDFTEGKNESWKNLKEELELTDEQKIDTLIRCAHFVRFPKRDASKLEQAEILDALQERGRFLEFHSLHENAAQLFCELEDAAGLKEVHQHNNRLNGVIFGSGLDGSKQARLCMRWIIFTEGKDGSLKDLQKELEPDKDEEKLKTLIRCALFVRFPERDASKLTKLQMLDALEGSTPSVNMQIDTTENPECNDLYSSNHPS